MKEQHIFIFRDFIYLKTCVCISISISGIQWIPVNVTHWASKAKTLVNKTLSKVIRQVWSKVIYIRRNSRGIKWNKTWGNGETRSGRGEKVGRGWNVKVRRNMKNVFKGEHRGQLETEIYGRWDVTRKVWCKEQNESLISFFFFSPPALTSISYCDLNKQKIHARTDTHTCTHSPTHTLTKCDESVTSAFPS